MDIITDLKILTHKVGLNKYYIIVFKFDGIIYLLLKSILSMSAEKLF